VEARCDSTPGSVDADDACDAVHVDDAVGGLRSQSDLTIINFIGS